MWRYRLLVWICGWWYQNVPGVAGTTSYSQQVSNYAAYLSVYSGDGGVSTTDLLPLIDLSTSPPLTVDMSIYSLENFDEVAGSITLIGALNFSWHDELASSGSPSAPKFNSKGISKLYFLVPYDKIWTPKRVLSNSVNSVEAVGSSSYLCRYNMASSMVSWKPHVVIHGACTPDITYFPFDSQSCSFYYVVWGYTADEVSLNHSCNNWDTSEYEENGIWSIVETKTETFIKNSQSVLKLSLVIERKPLYFAFNITLPVFVLCALNAMVFWLPVESGERIGFSVTCFLSFVVMLNMFMGMLPRTSSPMSYLCYYLVVMMALSGLTTAAVVIEMQIFYKDKRSRVPRLLQNFILFWRCSSRLCPCLRKSAVGQASRTQSLASQQRVKSQRTTRNKSAQADESIDNSNSKNRDFEHAAKGGQKGMLIKTRGRRQRNHMARSWSVSGSLPLCCLLVCSGIFFGNFIGSARKQTIN